jgi:hypothetical protein
MKYSLLFLLPLGAMNIALPSYAQFTTFPTGSDNCSNVCIRLDVGSVNSSVDTFAFNNSSNNNSNSGIRWQIGITWRPNAPEVTQAEAERVKQKLEDNRSLIIALADAIAQGKPELARGLAIILAPRLNYADPKQLIAELKEGTINIGQSTPATNPNSSKPPNETPLNSGDMIIELK